MDAPDSNLFDNYSHLPDQKEVQFVFKNNARLSVSKSQNKTIDVRDLREIIIPEFTQLTLYTKANYEGERLVLFDDARILHIDAIHSFKISITPYPCVYKIRSTCPHTGIKYWVSLPPVAIPHVNGFNIFLPNNDIVYKTIGKRRNYRILPLFEGLQIVDIEWQPVFRLKLFKNDIADAHSTKELGVKDGNSDANTEG